MRRKEPSELRTRPLPGLSSHHTTASVIVDGPSLERLLFSREMLAEFDLHELPLQVLAMLIIEPGNGVKRLSERLVLSKGTVSAVLRGLRERGLIESRQDSSDGRRRNQYLTADGEQLIINYLSRVGPIVAAHRRLAIVGQRPLAAPPD